MIDLSATAITWLDSARPNINHNALANLSRNFDVGTHISVITGISDAFSGLLQRMEGAKENEPCL